MTENDGQADRRAQIVAAAREKMAETGFLQPNIAELSETLGVSNSLFWTYFANGDALVATVFGELIDELDGMGLARACRDGEAVERLMRCAQIYLQFIGDGGLPLSDFVRGDELGRLDPLTLQRLRADLRHLATALRRDFDLSVRESYAWIEMLVAIPEELGRKIGTGALNTAEARDISDTLIGAAIDAIRPAIPADVSSRRGRTRAVRG